jgi:hypothetical protein
MVRVGIKRGEDFVEGFKVGSETQWAEMGATKRQGLATLTKVFESLVEGHNALNLRDAAAQRSCYTKVSNTSGPRIGGGNAKKRAFETGDAGFTRMDRACKIPIWNTRGPASEDLGSTFDRVAERTAGLSS